MKIDQRKTIICFLSSIENKNNSIKNLLENINGIHHVEVNTKSSQATIEYDQFTISYFDIVKTLKDANFDIE
jgi:copper chaperone CopZ